MWNALGAHHRRSWIARHTENGLPAARKRRSHGEIGMKVEGGDTAAAPEFNARIDEGTRPLPNALCAGRKVPKNPDTAGLLKSAPPHAIAHKRPAERRVRRRSMCQC